MEDILWSIDKSPEHAHQIYQDVLKCMQNPIVMCILTNSHINPILAENVKLEETWKQQDHGWLFSKEAELKWRRLDNELRFVYLGKSSCIIPENNTSKDISDLKKENAQEFIAWGTKGKKPDFYEERLGQSFAYPIDEKMNDGESGTTPAFEFIKYINPNNGELKFWRHSQIKWANCK